MSRNSGPDAFERNKKLIIKFLRVLFPGCTIYLFGSRARKTNTERSDIDLAIDIGEKIPLGELYQARDVLSALRIPQTIDLVDLKGVGSVLRDQILSEGIIWD